MRRIAIIDTTLRDGLQAPGVHVALEERIAMAKAIDALGVDELELGIAAKGVQERQAIKACARALRQARGSVWCRAQEDDIAAASACGVTAVHISLPVSDEHLGALGWRRETACERMHRLVFYARHYFDDIRIGLMDASRAPLESIVTLCSGADRLGVSRIRIADTVGSAMPWRIMRLIETIGCAIDPRMLEFHAHNDLGMATANALCAIQAGAGAVSATIGGFGERAGNAAVEQIAVALKTQTHYLTNIRHANLPAVVGKVANAFKVIMPKQSPIIGVTAFTHESGVHCHGMLQSPKSFQAFDADLVGAQSRFVVGASSGKSSVRAAFAAIGVSLSPREAARILPLAQKKARRKGRALEAAELIEFLGEHAA